jgi:hypothetical protein
MSLEVVYPQWRDQQRHDRTPFSDRVVVPDGLDVIFLDAALYVYGAVGPLWLSAITVDDARAEVEITDGTPVATGYCYRHGDSDVIRLVTATGQSAGVLVGQPGFPGLFTLSHARVEYTRDQTEFAAGVVMAMPGTGVLSLTVAGGGRMAGPVTLVAEHGVRFDWDADARRVMVHVQGVAAGGAAGRSCLKTISHIRPNDRGEFKLVGSVMSAPDSALRITSGVNSVTVNVIGG